MEIDQTLRRAMFAAAVAVLAALAACDRHNDAPLPSAASPSAVVIGTKPAEPSGDPPGTTPVASNTSDVSKPVETTRKPQEGDTDNHSTLAPVTPQKAQGVNPQEMPERKKQ